MLKMNPDGSASFAQEEQASSDALTNLELRATPVPSTGPVTDEELRAAAVPVSGPLTDAQLRATVVPVSLATVPALVAGSAVIGKVSIDQTTNGSTNGIALVGLGFGGNTISTSNGISAAGTLRITIASDSTGQVAAIGKAAAGATISGAPVLNGGAARTTNPTAVADGQVSNIMTDKVGRLVTVASHIRNLVEVQTTTITSSTTETPIVSAIASTFCDLTSLTITNAAATSTLVTIKDSTGGTTRGIYSIAANGSLNIPFNPPLPQATVGTAWTATCSASTDSIYVQAVYVRNT